MNTSIQPSRAAFAAALSGIGILGLICGDATMMWEPIPTSLPGRPLVLYLCALIALATGIGLLARPAGKLAGRVLVAFMLLWLVLLKLPGLLREPAVMVRWETFGETTAILAGAVCLIAAGAHGIRVARLLLVAALPMFGLAHFAYPELTASLVPTWLGFPLVWTYLTGAASLAAAAGMLFGIFPRLAVTLEAVMFWGFTLLVWVPRIVSAPADQGNWTEFLISAAIAASAWLIADTYRELPWFAAGKAVAGLKP